jgi:hypothetical protein
MPLMEVLTPKCPMCGDETLMKVDGDGLRSWFRGAFIQDAFPDMDVDSRELLISGTHPACWSDMLGEMEEQS